MTEAAPVAHPADVMEAVSRALWQFEPVRSRDLPIALEWVHSGELNVRGHVPSRIIKDSILEIVKSVPGVAAIQDELVADPDLELAIAEALARDGRTGALSAGPVQVFAQMGAVTLVGELNEDLRQAVRQVAGSVAGVRSIVDRLSAEAVVPGVE